MFAKLSPVDINGAAFSAVSEIVADETDGAVECGESVAVGDICIGHAFFPRAAIEAAQDRPPPSAQDVLVECLRGLADRRWRATQRFSFQGVQTDASPALAVVTAAVVSMQLPGGDATKLWKLADGVYRTFALADLVAFGRAIEQHIQACFANEARLAALMAAAAPQGVNAIEAIDRETGWP